MPEGIMVQAGASCHPSLFPALPWDLGSKRVKHSLLECFDLEEIALRTPEETVLGGRKVTPQRTEKCNCRPFKGGLGTSSDTALSC